MDDERAQHLGEYIRHTREARGMSLRSLAKQAHIDSGGLTRLECGKVHAPRPDTLCSLAHALHVSLADLFALVGYVAPQELPSIRPYLRAKYSSLPEGDARSISEEVEQLSKQHTSKPNSPPDPDNDQSMTT